MTGSAPISDRRIRSVVRLIPGLAGLRESIRRAVVPMPGHDDCLSRLMADPRRSVTPAQEAGAVRRPN